MCITTVSYIIVMMKETTYRNEYAIIVLLVLMIVEQKLVWKMLVYGIVVFVEVLANEVGFDEQIGIVKNLAAAPNLFDAMLFG